MELEIKNIFSGDIADLEGWQKKTNEDVYFHLEIEVGEFGERGGNIFQLVVSTPEGVRIHHVGEARRSFNSLRKINKNYGENSLLIIKNYNWNELFNKLNEIVKSCERDTWEQSVKQLRRCFHWEYEGMN